jgi:hypothetical protein
MIGTQGFDSLPSFVHDGLRLLEHTVQRPTYWVTRRKPIGCSLELQHQTKKALKQGVVQFSRNALPLAHSLEQASS